MSNNPLIPVFSGKINNQSIQLVNARELHQFLAVGKDFSTWIKDRITQYEFVENQDYILTLPNFGELMSCGLQGKKDYHITLDMAKELSMVERNDKGKQARRYFIDCEHKLHTLKQPQQAQLDMFNTDQITISKDDYIDLLKSKNQLLEVALSHQSNPTTKSPTKPQQEKRKWYWTQADIDLLNDYVKQGLANWKIAELTGRSMSAVSCAIARYVVKGGVA